MGKMLLGLAAVAAVAATAPASAGTPEEPFVGVPNVNATVGTVGGAQPGFVIGPGGHPSFSGGHFGRSGRSSGSGNGVWINGGQWAQYNNEAFKSDGYNDWWHINPERAYPAWMRNNQDCARQWYAGSTLRC
jgi:hypothetical protein